MQRLHEWIQSNSGDNNKLREAYAAVVGNERLIAACVAQPRTETDRSENFN